MEIKLMNFHSDSFRWHCHSTLFRGLLFSRHSAYIVLPKLLTVLFLYLTHSVNCWITETLYLYWNNV